MGSGTAGAQPSKAGPGFQEQERRQQGDRAQTLPSTGAATGWQSQKKVGGGMETRNQREELEGKEKQAWPFNGQQPSGS